MSPIDEKYGGAGSSEQRQPYRRKFEYSRFDDRSDDLIGLGRRSEQREEPDGFDEYEYYDDFGQDEQLSTGAGRGVRGYDGRERDRANENNAQDSASDERRGFRSRSAEEAPGADPSRRERPPQRRSARGSGRGSDLSRYGSGRNMGHGSDRARHGSARFSARRRKRAVTVSLAVLLCALAAGAGLLAYIMSQRVTTPLEISTALTGMDSAAASQLVTASVNERLSRGSVQISSGGASGTVSLADCEFRLSEEPDGTLHKKAENGARQTYLTVGNISFNATKLLDALHAASPDGAVRPAEPDYYADIRQDMETREYSGTLIVRAGTDGYGIDMYAFMNELLDRIYSDQYTPISIAQSAARTPQLSAAGIYADIHAEPKDAYAKNDGSGNISYVPEVMGVEFDSGALAAKMSGGGTEWTVPLSLTVPRVTRRALMAETFPDLLATYSTSFASSNEARSGNLARAGEYINGTILQPGDVFSFNGTVGQRTPERGFQKATVYSSEGTDEDYGGGICQTSSTLFYCAIKANMEVVERVNHRYTVGYMVDEEGNTCYGNDATVNWGSADMKFRNSKEFPIKLECVTKSGVITFNIWGTWDGYTAEYTYQNKDITDYQIVYRLPEPDKKDHAGQKGRTVTSFRHIYYQAEQGVGEREEISSAREFVSKYIPMPQIKYVEVPPDGYELNVLYDKDYKPTTTAQTNEPTNAPTSAPTSAPTESEEQD